MCVSMRRSQTERGMTNVGSVMGFFNAHNEYHLYAMLRNP